MWHVLIISFLAYIKPININLIGRECCVVKSIGNYKVKEFIYESQEEREFHVIKMVNDGWCDITSFEVIEYEWDFKYFAKFKKGKSELKNVKKIF